MNEGNNSEGNMQDPLDKIRFEYAWKYFEFHAKQRTTMFNFFIALSGVILGACAKLYIDNNYDILFLISLVGAGVTYCFMRIDWRNEELIHIAEDELETLEDKWIFKEEHFVHKVRWPRRRNMLGLMKEQRQVVNRGILRRQEYDRSHAGKSKNCHGRWMLILHWGFFVLYIFMAFYFVDEFICSNTILYCCPKG